MVIYDICKQEKEIFVVKKGEETYVVCDACKDKVNEHIIDSGPSKQEKKHTSEEDTIKEVYKGDTLF